LFHGHQRIILLFSVAANTETICLLGIDVEPDKAFSAFIDVSNYEPNDGEANACIINRQEQIMLYLYKGDFNYYCIKL
jgi:hypothetical protein